MRGLTKGILAGALVVSALAMPAAGARAQVPPFPTTAGNIGWAGCSPNSGVSIGGVDSGGNSGTEITLGETWGDVDIDAGRSTNDTDVSRRARGGPGLCGGIGGWPF